MNTAQPIRDKKQLEQLKGYYRDIDPNKRNHLLIIIGLNTALRISDILSLRWCDVYSMKLKRYCSHIHLKEKKTGKVTSIYLNSSIREALLPYYLEQRAKAVSEEELMERHIFLGQKDRNAPITRVQAFRIIKTAASGCKIEQSVSCHSLRKTFGYHAWKQGYSPSLLISIYNHSSYKITMRYLCIEQDDRDEVFRGIKL